MKKIIDNFSIQSESYKKFRPEYPDELYEFILSNTKGRGECWDCGTGNGQVAKALSKYFEKVYATDISQNQIALAEKKSNIEYSIVRAEKTKFKTDQFDLITVAQAIHWFDFKKFYEEVRRVGKPNSKLFVWGYGLLRIDEKVDSLVDEFYQEKIGSYWNQERIHIDEAYETIGFDFEEIAPPNKLAIKSNWKVDQLIGYLNSWSGVQHYRKKNEGENPVDQLAEKLSTIWMPEEIKPVKIPIFMKVGLIK